MLEPILTCTKPKLLRSSIANNNDVTCVRMRRASRRQTYEAFEIGDIGVASPMVLWSYMMEVFGVCPASPVAPKKVVSDAVKVHIKKKFPTPTEK